VIFAALVALVFIVGAQMWGLAAGLFAAASLTLMPRLFFHGHLTALDIPVALAWLCTVWLFWRWTVRGSTRLWPAMLVLGLAYGAALATKNTSFLLPPVLLLWALLFQRTRQAAVMLIGMGIIASLFFVISWPWLYTDLAGHLSEYVQRMTVGHWDISQYYLGRLYARPPWHYPFVVVAVTVPSTILLVALIGAGRVAAGGRQGKAGWLILMNALAPILFFAFVSGQAYGSERLFLVVFPFLALLAGMGFENIVTSLWSAMTGGLTHRQRQDASHSTGRAVVAACLAIMLLAPGLVGIISMHPYQLSYFSEIIGGAKGAEQAGLEITYWCETYQAALPFLNALPEANPSIWTEEDGVLYTYQQAGRLRGDARVGGRVVKAGPLAADYALIHRRPSGYSPDIERILRERTPVFTVRHANTDLAYVFKIQ
jgi:4-amino-4-deoxy-L-arabinose transferase-like glycosyltransferase